MKRKVPITEKEFKSLKLITDKYLTKVNHTCQTEKEYNEAISFISERLIFIESVAEKYVKQHKDTPLEEAVNIEIDKHYRQQYLRKGIITSAILNNKIEEEQIVLNIILELLKSELNEQ